MEVEGLISLALLAALDACKASSANILSFAGSWMAKSENDKPSCSFSFEDRIIGLPTKHNVLLEEEPVANAGSHCPFNSNNNLSTSQ